MIYDRIASPFSAFQYSAQIHDIALQEVISGHSVTNRQCWKCADSFI